MATVEELQTALDALRAEFDEFKTYAKPVIDGHQPLTVTPLNESWSLPITPVKPQPTEPVSSGGR